MNVQNKNHHFNYAQYDMLTLCTELAAENQSKVDLIPDFKSAINEVGSKLNTVNILIASEQEDTKGTAIKKRELKYALADKMLLVTEPFAGWADSKGNAELFTAFSKPVSTYRRMRPSAILSQADYIITTVTPLLQDLTGTTINQLALDEISTARNSFAPFATRTRSKTVSKTDDLIRMVNLLNDCMNITRRQLDRLVVGFLSLNENSFYNEWVRSRKLTPYGTLTTRASVDVYMGDANSPIQGALVKIDNTPLKGTTDDRGHTTISRIPFKDEQHITVTAPGFENPVHAGPFTFKKGKATHLIINMNEFNIPAPVNENSNSNVPA